MSQDLATQQQLGLLQGIKQNLGSAFAVYANDEESLSDGIGSSYGILHYRGKVWSLSYRGQTYIFTRPDDGSPASYIDVVVLRQARSKSKSYYEGFDQDSMNKRPICSSIDGVTPDMDAQQKQATQCAICPRNQWKTDAQGRKTKDCSDYKRIAVLLMPTVSARMFNGQPLMEPVFLRVPAASLADLSNYGDQLKQLGIPYFGVVTRVSFDPTKAHPQFQFRPLQGLTDAEGPVVLPMRDSETTKRIIGDDVVRALPAPAQPQLQVPAQPTISTGFAGVQAAPPPPPVQPMVMQAPPPVQQPQFVAPQPAAPAPTAAPVIDAQPITTGFVTAGAMVANPAPTQTPAMTAADVGAPEEADAAIDARLAALLPQAGVAA